MKRKILFFKATMPGGPGGGLGGGGGAGSTGSGPCPPCPFGHTSPSPDGCFGCGNGGPPAGQGPGESFCWPNIVPPPWQMPQGNGQGN